MDNLQQQIDNLKTLQESYDVISQAAEAYNTGKVQLAANITAKGVQASATETLPELAEKVSAIAQQPIILSPSEVGDMYAMQQFGSLTTPNYWNLYEVLNILLNDGRLLNYGGILLAEYYRGYDSLALSGVGAGGAYVVSDMENGQFKMYTEDTTHTWATEFDGKSNRWVAYCFANEYHNFQITDTNTSPRSIFIGRKVGTITSLVNGRVSQIVVPDGNLLKCISGDFDQNWGGRVVIRNLKEQVGNIVWGAKNTESIYVEGDSISSGIVYVATAAAPLLSSIIVKANVFSSCTILSGTSIFTFDTKSVQVYGNGTISLSTFKYLHKLGNIKEISITSESLSFENTPYGGTPPGSGCVVYLNYIDNDKTKSVVFTHGSYLPNGWEQIEDVVAQDGWCKPLDISKFLALTEANMYAHILQRLKQDEPDCGDGVTITLGSTNLAKLTSAESVQLLDDLTNIYGYTFA